MINGQLVLAVVPARAGSKGLPGKNLKKIKGRSLVELAVESALLCPEIDATLLSTDSEAIIAAAKKVGLNEIYRRPDELAGDFISDVQVLEDAIKHFEERNSEKIGYVVMLQPTSPLRRIGEVSTALQMMETGQYDSLWSVSEVDLKFHPDKQLVVKEGNLCYFSSNGGQIIARQQLNPTLIRNGLFYVVERDLIFEKGTLLGERCGFIKVDRPTVSIDDHVDLMIARRLFKKRTSEEEIRETDP